MIYMKLILACLLAAAPFVYAAYMRSGKHSLPRVIKRLYEGMKKSDNFRNFFTLILLMVLVAYQYVDFHASTAIAEMLNETDSCADTATTISIYGKLMSSPYATIIAAGLSLPLFSYKLANRVLTELHNNQKLFPYCGHVDHRTGTMCFREVPHRVGSYGYHPDGRSHLPQQDLQVHPACQSGINIVAHIINIYRL